MKKEIACLSLVAVMCSLRIPEANAANRQAIENRKQELKLKEKEGNWKKVHWSKDLKQALANSRKENKPLLIVLVVGHMGKSNASEC